MLRQSIRSILAKNYQQSFDEVKKAIDLGVSPEHKSTAYNLLGTFNFLLGEGGSRSRGF